MNADTMADANSSYEARASELFQRNLAAFKEYNLSIYNVLNRHKSSSQLIFDEAGNPDIQKDGTRLFKGKAQEHAARLFQDFLDNPTRIALAPPEPGVLDRYGNPLLDTVLKRARSENISFKSGLPDGDPFTLVVFGIELGLHLPPLLDKLCPVILHIIEADVDHLFHSLSVIPWHEYLARQHSLGGFIMISFIDDPYTASAEVELFLRHFSPATIDGTTFFSGADKEFAEQTIFNISQNAGLFVAGLGFVFDECLMLKNTYLNLKGKTSQFLKKARSGTLSTPVFVVGAGPSLDADIDFIRNHANTAIIISTGSAIRSLLVNGITPDFHVEMENIHVYSSINELSKSYDLSPICLVIPTSIEHHIVEFFDDVLYYVRDTTPVYPLFGFPKDNSLTSPGPLVVNASFSLALDIGGKNIYMFGTDFGSRGEGRDHAKDNVVFTESAIIGYTREYGHPVEANFHGQFFASSDFVWGLKKLQQTIKFRAQDRSIFNCSDGAKIEGATPARSTELTLKTNPKRKIQDLKRIHKNQSALPPRTFDAVWNTETLQLELDKCISELSELFGRPAAWIGNGYMAEYMRLVKRAEMFQKHDQFTPGDRAPTTIATIIRGTLDNILVCLRYYLARTKTSEDSIKLRTIVAEEICTTLTKLLNDVHATLNDPTQILPKKAGGTWDENDFIQEATYTWGNVSRNAPCPCGSGKRYKHCHGKTREG